MGPAVYTLVLVPSIFAPDARLASASLEITLLYTITVTVGAPELIPTPLFWAFNELTSSGEEPVFIFSELLRRMEDEK